MMRRIIVCAFSIGFLPLFSAGQSCKENFLGSKTLYQSQQKKYSQPPNGYMPVFINHVGRHGSRHVTKDVNSSFIYQLLLRADSLSGLSAAGKLLKEKILRLEKIEKKNFKSISLQGKKEQQGLADRMYANNQHVFERSNSNINIAYTKEIRTLQTCDAFLAELKTKIKEAVISKQPNDTTLRFYDLSPAYLAFKEYGSWMRSLQQLKTAVKYDEMAGKIVQQFFTASFFNSISNGERAVFTADLFGFICICYSLQKETEDAGYKNDDVNMESFLTCRQLAVLAKFDNAEDFLQKGPGTDVNDIPVKIAVPLLADFIKTTDAFIKTNTVNVQLRFAHAETIAPYAALLGFDNAARSTMNAKDINRVWDAAKVIPLSSNIQWILYQKKGSESYLVKFLLNEKEVSVKGLTTKTFPYYTWNDVRSFYIKKIQSFNTGLDADYLQYLKEGK